ncbi:MAG: glycoside hydrolase family 3 C-terminal domain-containing protein, partial [Micrococcales bacterium]|nr:glycoside hydrolase family 3 C-terminal domain-containing protein [Micrococcales bacterium]
FEYLSEDQTLAASLATAWVRGIQGVGVAACLKHFAANNQETQRFEVSVEASEATLRETYLEAFRRVIEAADPWALMCSYNRIGGVYASQNAWLLTRVLRDEWGYDGMVMSDWGAVHDPVEALRAGLDLEMPGTDGRSARAIREAIECGRLGQECLDRSVQRVVGFVRRTMPDGRASSSAVRECGVVPGERLPPQLAGLMGTASHHALAREAAAGAAVLLRNERDTLPLTPGDGRRLLVVGEYAETPRVQGGGSSGVAPMMVDSPLREIRAQAGGDVDYARGRAEAVAAAARADVVIAFAGTRVDDEAEGRDRDSLDLPAEQTALLNDLAGLGKPLVVVLAAGAPVALDQPWHDAASAILLTHLGGQAVGGATADLLFGRANPSGKLAETWPLRLGDTPGIDAFPGADGLVFYDEGQLIGYRWYDALGLGVRYPFGFGLSYSGFELSDLVVAAGERVDVCVTVTNRGPLGGAEVVQVYAGLGERRVLVGFEKVWLLPGDQRRVSVPVPLRHLARWSATDGWAMPGGDWRFWAGTSSREIQFSAVVKLARRSFAC